MNRYVRHSAMVLTLAVGSMNFAVPGPALAASAQEINDGSARALKSLYASSPTAKALADKAKATLVFPSVLKAGLIIGGQGGDGALYIGGKPVAYYNTAAVSFGLHAGAQEFGYVLFFMSDSVLSDFRKASGFEIGVGPTVVVVDAGAGKDVNTLTGKADVYAMIFDQKGLMAGLGLQGTKITKIER